MDFRIEKFHIRYLDEIYMLIVETVKSCYFEYYPKEAVDFFISYHSKEAIKNDSENVIILKADDNIIGTGTLVDTEIKRVFVLPQYHGRGFGRIIMNHLENEALHKGYKLTELHSSLFAKKFYNKIGYKMFKLGKTEVGNNEVLYFQRMAKPLIKTEYDKTLDLKGKKFGVINNEGENAEFNSGTVFYFYQYERLLYAEYSGGNIRYGEMFGIIEKNHISFYYKHENPAGLFRKGKSESRVIKLPANKIRLINEWQCSSQEGRGVCILEEI